MSVFDNQDLCTCLTTNIYFKVCMAVTFSLVLTFIHEMSLFKEKYVLMILLALFVLFSWTQLTDDFGSVLMILILVVLSANFVFIKSKQPKPPSPTFD